MQVHRGQKAAWTSQRGRGLAGRCALSIELLDLLSLASRLTRTLFLASSASSPSLHRSKMAAVERESATSRANVELTPSAAGQTGYVTSAPIHAGTGAAPAQVLAADTEKVAHHHGGVSAAQPTPIDTSVPTVGSAAPAPGQTAVASPTAASPAAAPAAAEPSKSQQKAGPFAHPPSLSDPGDAKFDKLLTKECVRSRADRR